MKTLIPKAKSKDLLKIDAGHHDQSGQSLSFARYLFNLKWMVNDEIKV